MDQLSNTIRERVISQIDVSREVSDEEINEIISKEVSKEAHRNSLTLAKRLEIQKAVFNSLRKLDVIQELLEDEDITEIMVNGPSNIFYEKNGKIHRFKGTFSSEDKMQDVIQQIVGKQNRVVNMASPIVDSRLSGGERVNIVLSPVSIDGSSITIRKFPKEPLTMNKLIEIGSLSKDVAKVLEVLIRAKYSIFISGGTGSGKTTFLNALSQFIPTDERIITIEDSAELQLLDAQNIVRLETRNANTEGVNPISIRDLIKTALRMRPDRIIVGECRGEEALDMLSAMNTGHDGSMSTGHANSCSDILSRLETMVIMGKELPLIAIRQQIASGIDIIVQLGRLRDKSRKVLEVVELNGIKNGEIQVNRLFSFEEDKGIDKRKKVSGRLQKRNELIHREKLIAAGLSGEFDEIFKKY